MAQSFRLTPTILVQTRWCNWLIHCDINRTMNGEFREDIEVILYKRKICKIDKLMTIEELQIGYQITKV